MSLVNWADGKVIREFKPDIQAASGVTVDDNNVMWVSSTYSCMHVACSPQDGKTIAKYWTPGAGPYLSDGWRSACIKNHVETGVPGR